MQVRRVADATNGADAGQPVACRSI